MRQKRRSPTNGFSTTSPSSLKPVFFFQQKTFYNHDNDNNYNNDNNNDNDEDNNDNNDDNNDNDNDND